MKNNKIELGKKLLEFSLVEYFENILPIINQRLDIEWLTTLFSNVDFEEVKPYLIRRKLKPIDKRFDQIEIIYDKDNNIKAIVWDFKISLSTLVNTISDNYNSYPEEFTNSTGFVFNNDKLRTTIRTRYPRIIKQINSLEELKYYDTKTSEEIINPTFEFIQYDISI